MHCVRKVTGDLWWVGANDRRTPLFENIHPIPTGVSYNSYLLLDERTVLFDCVDWSAAPRLVENVEFLLNGRDLDYIVLHHLEPDHGAGLWAVLQKWPKAKIISSLAAQRFLDQFGFAPAGGERIVAKEGEQLSFGRHALTFYAAPMVHWPDVMVSFLEPGGILFSADAFGAFGALNGKLFDDELDVRGPWLAEARRYYTNIVGKYGPQVMALLKKASALDIKMICPLHGPVWRRDFNQIIDRYVKWASYEPEVQGVVIPFASIYGHTETAANILACRLAELGVPVEMHDVSVTHYSYVLSDCFKYSHIVFAAPTFNNGVFDTMEHLLRDLQHHNLQNRKVALIQNGSWAPASGKLMAEILGGMKNMEVIEAPVTLKSALAPGQESELEALAQALAASVKGEEPAPEAEPAPAQPRGFVCKICGFIYEGDTLPDDFTCPICRRPVSDFEPVQ